MADVLERIERECDEVKVAALTVGRRGRAGDVTRYQRALDELVWELLRLPRGRTAMEQVLRRRPRRELRLARA